MLLPWGATAAGASSEARAPLAADAPARAGLTLEQLIAFALANDPNIELAELRVDSARGDLLIERSAFEPLLDLDLDRVAVEIPQASGTVAESDLTRFAAAWSQLMPTGLSVGATAEIDRNEPADAMGFDTTSLAWTFRQPLARDRGRRVVAAGVLAAEEELGARAWDRVDQVARRIALAVEQYWRVVAAVADLETLRASEESSRVLLDNTLRLIAADLQPAADRVLVEADLLAKETATLSAESSLYAARQELGRVIGMLRLGGGGPELPAESFSDLEPVSVASSTAIEIWVQRALAARPEMLGARRRVEAARILERAARNDLLPRVDLLFTPSYEVVSLDTAGLAPLPDLSGEASGFSATLGLDLSWPWLQRAARGRLLRSASSRRQLELEVELVRDDVIAGVRSAIDAVERSALQVVKAGRSVELFEQAVLNEEKKLQAGSSTLIDVINQRDRLTAIRRQTVRAQLELALAMLELRFQTGTLVEVEGADLSVPVAAVLTLPWSREAVP